MFGGGESGGENIDVKLLSGSLQACNQVLLMYCGFGSIGSRYGIRSLNVIITFWPTSVSSCSFVARKEFSPARVRTELIDPRNRIWMSDPVAIVADCNACRLLIVWRRSTTSSLTTIEPKGTSEIK